MHNNYGFTGQISVGETFQEEATILGELVTKALDFRQQMGNEDKEEAEIAESLLWKTANEIYFALTGHEPNYGPMVDS